MDLNFTPAELAFRDEVRGFMRDQLPKDIAERVKSGLALHADDYTRWQKILYQRGWGASGWPKQFGGPGWGPVEMHIFDEEAAAAGAPRTIPFGLKMVAPVIMAFGSPEQQKRFLPRIISAEDWWCQGYSEPGAGSDLASLKTRAELQGDHYVVNGQKTWNIVFNSVTVLLENAQSYGAFNDALSAHPALRVDALTEPAYLERVSRPIHRLLTIVAVAIGGIMAIGALFGALNTMYSAVSARLREIATFHALGFGASAIVASILIEALLLALLGAGLGAAIAYAAFDGQTISTLGGTRWDSQLVYSLTVTPGLLASATGIACAIGFIGGLFPALRAVRASVADALRTI